MKLTPILEKKLEKLADKNSFYRSLWNQYADKEYLSENQVEKIKEAYSG